jgi:hypothetical protein
MATLLMLLGGAIPYGTYIVPVISGAVLIPVLREYGPKQMLMLWAAISLLSLILVPDKEMALMFVLLLGWYPALKPALDKLPCILRWILKLVTFNIAIVLIYSLLIFVLNIPQDREGIVMTSITLLLGNITFLIYDRALIILEQLYIKKYRKLLFKN